MSEPDGYLFLGAAETVVGLTEKYRVCPNRRGVYLPNDARAAPSIVPGMASGAKLTPARAGK